MHFYVSGRATLRVRSETNLGVTSSLQDPALVLSSPQSPLKQPLIDVVVSPQGSRLHNARSLSTYAPCGQQPYGVIALRIHLCPRGANPFLLEKVKLVWLILSHMAFHMFLLLEEATHVLRDVQMYFLAPLSTLDAVDPSL